MPSLLLDTHILLWWLSLPTKISKEARKLLKNNSTVVFVSAASLWEISIKASLGRLECPFDIIQQLEKENFRTLAISGTHATHIRNLPLIHQDPFDRMLIAQAELENLVLVSRDQNIAQYPNVKVLVG